LDRRRIIRCIDERFGATMTEKTDAIFLLALLILTIVGLAVSSATHAKDAGFPTEYLRLSILITARDRKRENRSRFAVTSYDG
jgi:hypothetical protein